MSPIDTSSFVAHEPGHPLDPIFHPKVVAVIGATETQNAVGRTLLWNLITHPFGGVAWHPKTARAPVSSRAISQLCASTSSACESPQIRLARAISRRSWSACSADTVQLACRRRLERLSSHRSRMALWRSCPRKLSGGT